MRSGRIKPTFRAEVDRTMWNNCVKITDLIFFLLLQIDNSNYVKSVRSQLMQNDLAEKVPTLMDTGSIPVEVAIYNLAGFTYL